MVSGSLSDVEGSESGNEPAPLITYSERFRESFPYYLAMGMTPEQYWDGDPSLTIYFRKAEQIRNSKANEMAWLQGMYIYEALTCVAPIFHDFAKRGTKPHPYASQPYPLTQKERKKEKVSKEKQIYEKGKKRMQAWMASVNQKFAKPRETNEAQF